jgi:hypothetical protein
VSPRAAPDLDTGSKRRQANSWASLRQRHLHPAWFLLLLWIFVTVIAVALYLLDP